MMDLTEFQDTHARWLRHNFPDAEPWEALAGMMEELGELAHAHLKGHNLIRSLDDPQKITAYKADAVGDIFIYLTSYCTTNGLSLERCIQEAWQEVEQRDWRLNPVDGRTDG
jgi:NTP pyrophosphatase (non-canonical NTP hydrolase)